jgi:uncharacterized protein YdiU (UPF0061 family)
MTKHDPKFNFDNTYARELEGFYVPWQGAVAPAPMIVQFNDDLAHDLGLDTEALNSAEGAAVFAGIHDMVYRKPSPPQTLAEAIETLPQNT